MFPEFQTAGMNSYSICLRLRHLGVVPEKMRWETSLDKPATLRSCFTQASLLAAITRHFDRWPRSPEKLGSVAKAEHLARIKLVRAHLQFTYRAIDKAEVPGVGARRYWLKVIFDASHTELDRIQELTKEVGIGLGRHARGFEPWSYIDKPRALVALSELKKIFGAIAARRRRTKRRAYWTSRSMPESVAS